jgi:hypothetical protein
MASQHCPICSTSISPNPRYPRYVCPGCASEAVSPDGRHVAFFNQDVSGGCVGQYVDTGAEYPLRECLIRGVRCRADEARFGGIVIEAVG